MMRLIQMKYPVLLVNISLIQKVETLQDKNP